LGLRFRFKVLLAFVLLVLLVALFLAFNRELGAFQTVLAVLISQAILQGSYFIGLATRALFRAFHRKLIATDELAATDKSRSNSGSIASN
jgi:UPF0716 family protein affecting phage T7 exclusion